jgi:hypothetical protein
MDESRTIRLSVAGRAAGPMTWSQRLMWQDRQQHAEEDHVFNLGEIVRLTRELPLEPVLAALEQLVLRHEALRSHFYLGPAGQPVQEVPAGGTVRVVVAAGAEVDVVQAELAERLRGEIFDLEGRELPVRFGVVTGESGLPHAIVAVFSHLAVDLAGVWQACAELRELLGEEQEPARSNATVLQPLDRAAFETSRVGLRLSDQALRHLRKQLSEAPQTPVPFAPGPADRPRYRRMEMRSPALTTALRVIAQRLKVTTSSVLLSGIAVVLGAVSGGDRVLLRLILGNRGFPDLRDYVGVAISNGYVCADLGAATFDELVRATASRNMVAQARSQCDPVRREEIVQEVGSARGLDFELSALFTDLRWADHSEPVETSAEDLAALREKTEVAWVGGWERMNASLFFHTFAEAESEPVCLLVDTAFVPVDRVEAVLRGLESTVVAAAVSGSAPLTSAAGLTTIAAPERGDDWLLLDHCWTRIADVTDVLARAEPAATGQVRVERDADGRQVLTAYVVPDGSAEVTPAGLHRAVLRELATCRTAKAPDEYVVCRAIDRRSLPADLRELPVVRRGSGRGEQSCGTT